MTIVAVDVPLSTVASALPVPHDDDEDRAVRAAIAMITDLRRWNTERIAAGKKPLDMGIGLNIDTVVQHLLRFVDE